jgi:ABC-type branched-subunit amino acid transport system substrate-binding protein
MSKFLAGVAIASLLIGSAFGACPDPRCIRVGAIIPATGRQKTQGIYLEAGYKMAIEEVNAAGGLYLSELNETYKIDYETRDSQSNGAVGLSVLQELISTYEPDSLLADYGASRSRSQVSSCSHASLVIVLLSAYFSARVMASNG